MSILAPDKIRSLGYVTNAEAHSRSKVDLQRVGQDIYDVLNQKPRRKGYKAPPARAARGTRSQQALSGGGCERAPEHQL